MSRHELTCAFSTNYSDSDIQGLVCYVWVLLCVNNAKFGWLDSQLWSDQTSKDLNAPHPSFASSC